jgi:hypothetical protein
MTLMKFTFAVAAVVWLAPVPAPAHDTGQTHDHSIVPAPMLLRVAVENKGPIRSPGLLRERVPVSGQGFWKFVAVTSAVPVPTEAQAQVKDAHGTLIVDVARDTVYWGLKGVGWVGFSNCLTEARVVRGDDAFSSNNLHGADILQRNGRASLVAAADNEGSKIYLTDTTFLSPRTLGVPATGPYATNKSFRPTDVAFVDADRLFITDGYARGYFMGVDLKSLSHEERFLGGRKMSKTPHGITYDPRGRTLLISARPEGQVQRWSLRQERYVSIEGLPEGTLLCDVDLWGDYGLAACLEGPNKSPGPLIILNLKRKTIVSTIQPKEELGYAFADHIHDAAWYFHKVGRRTDVYLVFTAWNPGGIGALKLVRDPR